MVNPQSTLRIQFHHQFTFQDLKKALPFIVQLGVRTIYASPIFKASKGSLHGYDVTDPLSINPEIGTLDELMELSEELKKHNIGWLQDIVPNHMSFDTDNVWLMDVLEKGKFSSYKNFFDSSFSDDVFSGKMMVPFLDSDLNDAIASRKLQVVYNDGLFILLNDRSFPLNLFAYSRILTSLDKVTAESHEDLVALHARDGDQGEMYEQLSKRMKAQLAELYLAPPSRTLIDQVMGYINSDPVQMAELLADQSYRFCHWRETNSRINYRRFFTVNGLICLNIQNFEVFEASHRLVTQLYNNGVFTGLRIDHIDGLYDPVQYLQRLRQLVGIDAFIVVEKILEPNELLDRRLRVNGTTGYDFLAVINNLFTRRGAAPELQRLYDSVVANPRPVHERIKEKKSLILHSHMNGELDNLTSYFFELGICQSSLDKEQVRKAIAALLVNFPLYRFYGNSFPLDQQERKQVESLFREASGDQPDLSFVLHSIYDGLMSDTRDPGVNERRRKFYQRWMQLTGPLMAKGVEDTLMYTFNRFVAHNEVGDSPGEFGLSHQEFHRAMIERSRYWPLSLNATATHDTKRGEDARMRLNVLSDLAEEWATIANEWFEINRDLTMRLDIARNDEYFIYQALVASYEAGDGDFAKRLNGYLQKALREAKLRSSWDEPDTRYEEAVSEFVAAILAGDSPFMKSFAPFVGRVTDHGYANSIAQLVVKMMSPGIPDTYQGSLTWDYSFVDPDNRRTVDFSKLFWSLSDNNDLGKLWKTRADGRIKVNLIHSLLTARNANPHLFEVGDYRPVTVTGRLRNHVLAFLRTHQDDFCLVVVALHTARLVRSVEELATIDWSGTSIQLDAEFCGEYRNLLTGVTTKLRPATEVRDLIGPFGFSLQMQTNTTSRSAGVLMPVPSLPCDYPIGDLGSSARNFADFLFESRQKVWQMLPLNVTDQTVGYSPYSAYSSMAGNWLLIDVHDLEAEGLLHQVSIRKRPRQVIQYDEALRLKEPLLRKAWMKFRLEKPAAMTNDWHLFLEQEKDWLDTFAAFELLYTQQEYRPWTQWPDEWRQPDADIIASIAESSPEEIGYIKWRQFIFFRQARALKEYCNVRGIRLMGDISFYVSHNSADVWMNQDLFDVDADGEVVGQAGVPPDYFNSEGQLWGMPVYKWSRHTANNYSWWVSRLKRSLQLFDELRLDHFRAFDEFWSVEQSKTGKEGTWVEGPGSRFFDQVKEQLGQLPFVAEDLGDVAQRVFDLRDRVGLPGMKVLQFAFGDDFPASPHAPHQYTRDFVVYTGTHDNNTTRGWYEDDLDEQGKRNLQVYLGTKVTGSQVADALMRLAYGSVARVAIIPIQDVLGLGAKARMNTPATTTRNWRWRLTRLPGNTTVEKLRKMVRWYGR